MKRVLLALIAATALAAAGTAQAATPTERKVATLQKQVKTLQGQVRTLQRQVRETQSVSAAAVLVGFCTAAITGDALQGTWSVVNQVAGRGIFAAPQPLDDRGFCNQLRVARQPNQVPPTISPFSSLLAILRQSFSSIFGFLGGLPLAL